jgi:hypothetical protein
MSYLIAVLGSGLLLTAFLVLTWVETSKGARLLSGTRMRMDRHISRATYIVRHIDWGGFFSHVLKLSFERVAHDLVHAVLLVVRTVERTLTRAIRTLRERVALRTSGDVPVEGSSLVATVSKFRKRRDRSTTKL